MTVLRLYMNAIGHGLQEIKMNDCGYVEYKDLKPLSFYWVLPAFDGDLDGEFEEVKNHWQNKEQPAMCLGRGKWVLLGLDSDEDWPVVLVGEEIVK